jgi:dimethylhistidine N-methyltransferase
MIRARAAFVTRAAPAADDARAEILAGMRGEPKQLPSRFFYDAEGSRLFDQICELPEYYLPRVETAILRERLPAFARRIGPGARIVEPGSGASTKTLILLDALESPAAYVPVDISESHLVLAAEHLKQRYPELEVLPVCADFTRPFRLPASTRTPSRTLVFFPGSTIGNFLPPDAVELLSHLRRLAGQNGVVMIGADLRKDPAVLERAYNDAAGITAAFNLNMLAHLNREYDGHFDLAAFRHRASWNETASRIEMHLESLRDQVVRVAGERFTLLEGESIWMESCHKYTHEQFARMAARAGLAIVDAWVDAQQLFSVQVAVPATAQK